MSEVQSTKMYLVTHGQLTIAVIKLYAGRLCRYINDTATYSELRYIAYMKLPCPQLKSERC